MSARLSACLLAVSLLVSPSLAGVCPNSCTCTTTRDGLHRAVCSNVTELYKFTLRQKHYNINILDLSHNNITKLTHELDRLTEISTLDLSTNGITEIKKFLHNAKKLVHLNLAHNRLEKLSLIPLPTSVSSLDLTNNMLTDLPSDLGHLRGLEHIEMDGNPLNCSCQNILARDQLLSENVFIDNVICASPKKLIGHSWLELKTKDVCKIPKAEINYLDTMMGDQPIDPIQVGEETSALKPLSVITGTDLDDGKIIQNDMTQTDDDDSSQFLRVNRPVSSLMNVEGSGEMETTTTGDVLQDTVLNVTPQSSTAEYEYITEDSSDGSGLDEGSGFGFIGEEEEKNILETTTQPELFTGPILPAFTDDNTLDYPSPSPPSVYAGGPLWHLTTMSPIIETIKTEKVPVLQQRFDTTVSEPIRVTQAAEVNELPSSVEDNHVTHKTGTYVCITIIVVLLVGLIGFAIVKGQIRKRRDRRLLRQQKRDVEQASKEMVDMNKSLLGKPAVIDTPCEKKVNGKYELVPTHEPQQKKNENGALGNGINHNDTNGIKNNSPRDNNQNKSSSKDNNLTEDLPQSPQQETSFESGPTSPDSRRDTNSLSSEDIFVPLNENDSTKVNGVDSDVSQPLINGDQTFSDLLSPSREYVPVYSPDMGRVRIKMAEIPKPKTPVLVNRSRSNAGDIIITPSLDESVRKSTT